MKVEVGLGYFEGHACCLVQVKSKVDSVRCHVLGGLESNVESGNEVHGVGSVVWVVFR